MSEWQAQQDAIASITDEYYSGAIDELEEKFTGRINNALAAIPDNAMLAGQDAAQSFIDGISGLDINELTLGVLEDADTESIGKTLGERFALGFSEGLGDISTRFAEAAQVNGVISRAGYGGYYSDTPRQNDTKVEVTTNVYLDGKEISAASESRSQIDQRIQGG